MAKKKAKRKVKKKGGKRKAAKRAGKKKAKKARRKVSKAKRKAPKRKATKKKAARKKAPKKKKAKKAKKKRKPNPAFMRPLRPSPLLAQVIGGSPIPRPQVMKKIWAYIRKHGLQDQVQRRMINADAKLKAVFGGKGRIDMFQMTKLISKHLT
jgi:upstream activation factor subunit UAF30